MIRRLWLVVALVAATVGLPSTADAATSRCPQWRATALAAGWTASEWPTLDRIMWRESRCNPAVYNGRGRDNSVGLTQINTYRYLWSGYRGVRDVCRLRRPVQLLDPFTNLQCAERLHDIYGGWVLWRIRF